MYPQKTQCGREMEKLKRKLKNQADMLETQVSFNFCLPTRVGGGPECVYGPNGGLVMVAAEARR